MKSNLKLQQDVQNAILWEPSMHAAEIGVTAKDGVVTLSGIVNSYSKKLTAENAAKKVKGVKAVAEEITIDYGYSFKKSDTELAQNILHAWKFHWEVPEDELQVKVEDGWVTLSGEVTWKYQETAAINSIKHLSGVQGVSSLILIKSKSNDYIEKESLEGALGRNWSINSKDVKVEVAKNKVKLTGIVHSLYQKDEATRLAWNTPGIASVDNQLAIIY